MKEKPSQDLWDSTDICVSCPLARVLVAGEEGQLRRWIHDEDLQVCEDKRAISGQAVDSGELNEVGKVHRYLLLPAPHFVGTAFQCFLGTHLSLTVVQVCFRAR